jgi:hypothetical protein
MALCLHYYVLQKCSNKLVRFGQAMKPLFTQSNNPYTSLPLPPTLSSFLLSLFLSLSVTQAHTHTHTLILCYTFSVTLSQTSSLSYPHAISHTPSQYLILSHTSNSLSYSFTLSHTPSLYLFVCVCVCVRVWVYECMFD